MSVVHFHDPELLLLARALGRLGVYLIYDAHENVPKQILSKPYLCLFSKSIIARVVAKVESSIVQHCAAVISVTEENVNRLSVYNENAFLVRNFPVLESFTDMHLDKKEVKFLYAGGITKIRGVVEIAAAAERARVPVCFYGPLESETLKKEITNSFSSFCGVVPQRTLFGIMGDSSVGFLLFHKVPNHMISCPNKLFEYMAAGMAVIASDIPMWKEIIEKHKCGICVNPQNIQEITDAITYMKMHPQEVKKMGNNGRHAVLNCYSWKSEAGTLLNCYKSVAGRLSEQVGDRLVKSEKQEKVFHITSVHSRYDTRIFTKECITLAAHGYDVTLIVCDGKGYEEKNGVRIVDAGDFSKCSRFERMRKAPKAILKVLKSFDIAEGVKNKTVRVMHMGGGVIHFHDPELLLISKKFARYGFRVVYDSHENVSAQILSKPYLHPCIRKIVSYIVSVIERQCVHHCNAVIGVTENNVKRFSQIHDAVFLVRNFPVLDSFNKIDFNEKEMSFLYAGGITRIRGVEELAKSALISKTKIIFCGPLESEEIKVKNKNEFTVFYGLVEQKKLFSIMKKSSVGFVILHKVSNYLDSYPIKLFEYMAAGMAVIASDIPMWKEIIEKHKCGICVNPQDIQEITNAITYMKTHPHEVMEMGRNGRQAVFDYYSWKSEAETLLNCYKYIFAY